MFNQVLARDGYSCVVTGILNQSSLSRCRELGDHDKLALVIETAHILNESTTQGMDPAVSEDTQDHKLLNKVPFHQWQSSSPLYPPSVKPTIWRPCEPCEQGTSALKGYIPRLLKVGRR